MRERKYLFHQLFKLQEQEKCQNLSESAAFCTQLLAKQSPGYCFFFTTCAQSYFPRTTLSLTPGRSWVLPPSTSTTLCSCRLCPSPGMKTTASLPLDSRTRAHFLFAELGFLGFRIMVFRTTAFSWGRPNVAPTDVAAALAFPWRCIWLRVAMVLDRWGGIQADACWETADSEDIHSRGGSDQWTQVQLLSYTTWMTVIQNLEMFDQTHINHLSQRPALFLLASPFQLF